MPQRLINGDIVEVRIEGKCIARQVRITKSWWSRAKGLLGTRSLGKSQGIWITPCNSIHMFGMLYSIGVVFLDDDLRVVKVKKRVVPFGLAVGGKAAVSALELSSDNESLENVCVGDQIEFRQLSEAEHLG